MDSHAQKPVKKERINKNGWLPFLIISGGLITLLVMMKLLMKLLAA